MSRRRDSIPPPITTTAAAATASETFNLRWHSIANPETSSADIMSSPDPLNDNETIIVPPSSQRVTRSQQRSGRFSSRAGSPRKQTFELEVGDNRSPQRLLVTVETEDGQGVASTDSTRRRLFPSPSPFPASRRAATATTTTTTVPLKESIEEEDVARRLDPEATPRRRGRPRKTNGTPLPNTSKKRKAGTPIKRPTPRRKDTSHLPDPLSDPIVQPSPSPRKRGRPPKNSSVEPFSEAGLISVAKTARSQADRRRPQAMASDVVGEVASETDVAAFPSGDEMDLVGLPTAPAGTVAVTDAVDEVVLSPPRDADSDIWMATASQDATPHAQSTLSKSVSRRSPPENVRRSSSADLASLASEVDDYGADVLSIDDASENELPIDATLVRRDDTIAQGEDFSMIFMDSIQSFQAFKSSMQSATHEHLTAHQEDFGEETSFIINQTLESVRQADATEMERDEHTEHAIENTENLEALVGYSDRRAETEDMASVQDVIAEEENVNGDHQPAHTTQEQDQHEEEREGYHHDEEDAMEEMTPAAPLELLGEQDPLTSESTPAVFSPVASSAKLLSSRWLRSPRKADVSPMRQRLVQAQIREADYGVGTTNMSVDHASSPLLRSQPRRRASGGLAEPDYEDSFSEIPQDVLTAATPRRPVIRIDFTEEADEDGTAEEREEEEREGGEDEAEQMQLSGVTDEAHYVEDGQPDHRVTEESLRQTAASNASSTAQTDRGRLPTPDDTPPNIDGETEESPEKSSVVSVSMGSSPPAPPAQLVAEQDSQSSVADQPDQMEAEAESKATISATPLNQISSPAQGPQSTGEESIVQQRSAHDQATRPALSAIVRAGRALQTITSDPPSPESHQYQLRSPFQSSASKASVASGSGSRAARSAGRRISLSPARQPPIRHHRQTASLDRLDREDPFSSASRNHGQISFMDALNRSINKTARLEPSPHSSPASSMHITPPNEDMSWVADEGPIGPELRGDNSLQDLARASTTAPAVGTLSNTNPVPASDEAAAAAAVEEEEEEDAPGKSNRGDDETDIWEMEAERSHLQASTLQAPASNQPPLHQRSQIPSPWMKSTDARPIEKDVPKEDISLAPEFEEYSLLEQRQKDRESQDGRSGEKANRFDLSSFFSSPNVIPGGATGDLVSKRTLTAPRVASESAATNVGPSIQTSSMFPSATHEEFRPRRNSRSSRISPTKPKEAASQSTVDQSASPETPDRLQMPVVAQKQNFTPRQRQTNQSYQPATGTSVAPTPPRMQLSRADIQRWQHQTSNASSESPGRLRPLLRPLPPHNASPSKSNLRSPLKPRTPGRVVEFASSVLSPAEQAQLRSERRSSVASGLETDDVVPQAQATLLANCDRENQDSDLSMTDASPLAASEKGEQVSLSRSVWSRRHWALLESIIQHRRQRAFDFDFPRRADKYLGKTVSNSNNSGAAIVLERWHLDCIDAFKDIVGGWNEGVLAMRLFSLLMAAEKRNRPQKKAKKQSQGAAMFH